MKNKDIIPWKKLIRRGKMRYSQYFLRIVHRTFNKKGRESFQGELTLGYQVQVKMGGYTYVEFLYYNDKLGIKLLDSPTDDCYAAGRRGRSKFTQRVNSSILLYLVPKDYQEEDLSFDLDNRIITVPVKFIKGKMFNKYDFIEEEWKK